MGLPLLAAQEGISPRDGWRCLLCQQTPSGLRFFYSQRKYLVRKRGAEMLFLTWLFSVTPTSRQDLSDCFLCVPSVPQKSILLAHSSQVALCKMTSSVPLLQLAMRSQFGLQRRPHEKGFSVGPSALLHRPCHTPLSHSLCACHLEAPSTLFLEPSAFQVVDCSLHSRVHWH